MKNKRIYLDFASITPLDQKVSKVMREVEEKAWGNPSSLHQEGEKAREILEKAKEDIALLLNCRSTEIYITKGGTDSINIALQGVMKDASKRLSPILPHIITSSIEHPGVLENIKNLIEEKKIEATFINPDDKGIVNPLSIQKEIKENTVLVCLMHANNEIGTMQPVSKVANIIREYRNKKPLNRKEPLLPYPYLLVDASQSALYENISLERLGADLLIMDGIKIYGPRGTGLLAVKHGVGILPTTFGGGQQKGLYPGTEAVPSAVGLAFAMRIASKLREKEVKRLTSLRDYTINKILREIPGSSLNGDNKYRLPNNINICFHGTDSEFLVIKLDTLGFAVSSASACLNLKEENSSYVIEALGKENCANSSLRFTLGRETKKSDLDKLIKALKTILNK